MNHVERIKTVMPEIGGKKMLFMIKESEESNELHGIGRDKFFNILRANGLLKKRKVRKGAPGTDSRETKSVYPNLKRDITVKGINDLLESDMTAIRIKQGYKPLSICMDVYSRKILGWQLSQNWSAAETVQALRSADKESGHKLQNSIHHSDQGKQYGSVIYAEVSRSLGIVSSMSRKATPTDAAHIERLNRTLKREFNLRRVFSTFEEAEKTIDYAVNIYNNLRPHWSLNLKTPSRVYDEGKI